MATRKRKYKGGRLITFVPENESDLINLINKQKNFSKSMRTLLHWYRENFGDTDVQAILNKLSKQQGRIMQMEIVKLIDPRSSSSVGTAISANSTDNGSLRVDPAPEKVQEVPKKVSEPQTTAADTVAETSKPEVKLSPEKSTANDSTTSHGSSIRKDLDEKLKVDHSAEKKLQEQRQRLRNQMDL